MSLILAIDTSCDETSAAVVDGTKVLSNVISSQIAIHKKYGGVFPALAKRAHEERIDYVVNEALRRAGVCHPELVEGSLSPAGRKKGIPPLTTFGRNDKIKAIAVTQGPGLAIALEVGIKKAKELVDNIATERNCHSGLDPESIYIDSSFRWNDIKLIAVNHLEGHIYSAFAQNANWKGIPPCPFDSLRSLRVSRNDNICHPERVERVERSLSPTGVLFPALCLIVSGGHTELVLMKAHGDYQVLGATLDDACGEALDKAAKILKLGYPGGPIIEKLAEQHFFKERPCRARPLLAKFTPPLREKSNLNFSYSGLKTQLLYLVQKMPEEEFNANLHALAYSFQKACFDQIIRKARSAIEIYQPKTLISGGGVIANKYLRKLIRSLGREYKIPTLFPPKKNLITDNAAMIGIAAHYKMLRNEFVENPETLDREPRLSL